MSAAPETDREKQSFAETALRLGGKSDEEVRPLPEIHDVPSYIEVRARRQIERYYEPKRQAMRRRARIVRAAQVVLGAISVALGLVAGLGATSLAPWIGVVGTVSGAVIAHSAAARYGFLELEYARTADELKRTITRYSIHEQDEESGLGAHRSYYPRRGAQVP